MTLCDASPLVGLIDRNDAKHSVCRQTLPKLLSPLITTWPCFTEAMYLLHKVGGHLAQDQLWEFLDNEMIRLHQLSDGEANMMRRLMKQYSDTPMDLADASLVAVAGTLDVRRIFTLDSHFYTYRLAGGQAFEVFPAVAE